MRGIPGSGVFIFFAVVFIIELFAFLAIRQVVDHRATRRKLNYLYLAISVLLAGILVYAFINPSKIRETQNYQLFYFVISVSFLNLVPKALLSVLYLVSLLLRLVKAHFATRVMLLSGVIISLGIMLNIGYGIAFGRKTIRVIHEEIHFKDLPKSLDGTKLLQISDFHLGSFQDDNFLKRCTQKINEIQPDLILFTGDMVNNYYQEMIGFEDELAAMQAKHGKFAILGNHDYGDYSKWENEDKKEQNHQLMKDKIEGAGFQLLLNESEKVGLKDTIIEIIGVENWGHRPFPQYADLDKAMQGTEKPLFKILMTHDPAHWDERVISETDIPLTLSGHTHAAQSGVLFAGIEFSPMYFIQKYWGGLYKNQDQYLYVNRGIGCVGLLGRIEMAPEITVLILRSK
jgi:hypothetical protein